MEKYIKMLSNCKSPKDILKNCMFLEKFKNS